MSEVEGLDKPDKEPDVDLISNVHDSVQVGDSVYKNGMTVKFNKRAYGLWLAKKVPLSVAMFLVSISTTEREYMIVQPGALPYPNE